MDYGQQSTTTGRLMSPICCRFGLLITDSPTDFSINITFENFKYRVLIKKKEKEILSFGFGFG